MHIVVAGVNYATSPLELRERLTLPAGQLNAALATLRHVAREGFIVATCNRMEVYALVADDDAGADALLRFLAECSQLDPETVGRACYVHAGEAAVQHALRVASGMDSMVLGEDQIQGQMKHALALARNAETLGPTLERLGAAALACGKRVRTFTGIGQHAVSLESLAVRAARERIPALSGLEIVLLGAGESASLILRQLGATGASRITIVSRSLSRATALAQDYGARARPLAELSDALAEADVLFACASAPRPLVTRAIVANRAGRRPGASLLCVDLGMPRGVDEDVAAIAGVAMLTLTELSAMAEAHRDARRSHIPAAQRIVAAEAVRFLEWSGARGAAKAIASLTAHADAVVARELERAAPRLAALTPEERETVAALAHRIARKLLHRPITTLKRNPEAELMSRTMESMFGASAPDARERSLPPVTEGRLEETAS